MTGQNRSAAVMQQRREARDSLDDFPTPPWAARALADHVLAPLGHDVARQTVWEPAGNRGHLVRGLMDRFALVYASDVHDYSDQAVVAGVVPGVDFLFPGSERQVLPEGARPDWIVTNPPFRLAAEFIHRGLALQPRCGVAVFVRSAFSEGGERYATLFGPRPPRAEAQFVERVVLHKGTLRAPGSKYLDPETGEEKTASTATAFAWFVWSTERANLCERMWIPPCRLQLERPRDYPAGDVAAPEAPLFGAAGC